MLVNTSALAQQAAWTRSLQCRSGRPRKDSCRARRLREFLHLQDSPGLLQDVRCRTQGAAAEVLAVVEKHKEKVIVDAYLTRGFEAQSDFFLRVHSYDMAATQAFLVDFRATRFGMYSDVTEQLVGMTKALNYITKDKSPEPERRSDRATYQRRGAALRIHDSGQEECRLVEPDRRAAPQGNRNPYPADPREPGECEDESSITRRAWMTPTSSPTSKPPTLAPSTA
jgi:hypothetical protein